MGCVASSAKRTGRSQANWEEPWESEKLWLQFQDLNRVITEFCDVAIPLPAPTTPPSQAPTITLYGTAHATLLTRVNECLYRQLFRPFHPFLSDDENEAYREDFNAKFQRRATQSPRTLNLSLTLCLKRRKPHTSASRAPEAL